MEIVDAKHRPHAIHYGEEPANPITEGPESLRVTLDRWGPTDALFTSMYDALQANWGDAPSRTVDRHTSVETNVVDSRVNELAISFQTGWAYLKSDERDYVESCFAGKTLQQVLEGITFDFCIDGVARAFTHQNVRTRLGAGFMQHGGRDNDWRHRAWTMPETMRRACLEYENSPEARAYIDGDLKSPITDWKPIQKLASQTPAFDGPDRQVDSSNDPTLRCIITQHLRHTRDLYAALVDAGIPWQDARRVLPIGMQTYIHDQYNYLALSGVLANRLEYIMDWEFNCVAQLMLREIKMKCPPLLSKYLGSHSDRAKAARFAGLESWPPDRKYPSPYDDCSYCGHGGDHHQKYDASDLPSHVPSGETVCSACENEGPNFGAAPMHRFVPKDRLSRQHTPLQMPFFVLHPTSMEGGPIKWISTNGEYPHAVIS